jgi:prepilin peptidase CpaA
VCCDLRAYRIPNRLVLGGAAAAVLLHAFGTPGTGFAGPYPGAIGFSAALSGYGVGLACLLPVYALRGMSAGDVKLMAMAGAFLGPADALGAAVFTFVAGTVLALLWACKAAALGRMARNVWLLLHSMRAAMSAAAGPAFDPRADTAVRLPYSLAIAAGTTLWVSVRLWN